MVKARLKHRSSGCITIFVPLLQNALLFHTVNANFHEFKEMSSMPHVPSTKCPRLSEKLDKPSSHREIGRTRKKNVYCGAGWESLGIREWPQLAESCPWVNKHLNAEFQRITRRDKKAFLSNQYKEIEENNRMGKTRDLFKKIRDAKGTCHASAA